MKLLTVDKTGIAIKLTKPEICMALKCIRQFNADTYQETEFKANLWRMLLLEE